ncbi:hypothetical protein LT85_0289 [Collimonas arenae]|uniref:Uncharacterized protein n=1 Tax=Collimonas arenae TaxID=279058 RepID=A0A0A1F6Y3_9BURK|nr:hypothetical protein [Collimonas arenae]AIY39449.1 hypothetical protein LT85_0289 [Collimonas arenae]
MELTKEILEDIFQITRQVSKNNMTLTEGKNELVRLYGINPNSATMSIRSLRHMINGERYRRALTIDATDYFLARIKKEDGESALKVALAGLSAHIDYRTLTGVLVPGLQSVLAKHSS